MSHSLAFARINGWPRLLSRAAVGLPRRLRDRLLAERLHAPGFRAERTPRVLGLSHMEIGPDFHARDFLWLEAVVAYGAASFAPMLRIGAHARLSDHVHIACLDRVTIGAHLLCGSRVLITDHAHGSYGDLAAGNPMPSDPAVPPAQRPLHSAGLVTIGDNVWLGDGVAVLAGAAIGEGCVVGANAVVTGPLPARTIAVGVPARPVRRWDEGAREWVPLPQAGKAN